MRRRTLLASIPALTALAGCNGRNSHDPQTPDSTTATPPATTTHSATTSTSSGRTTDTTTTETPTTSVRDPNHPRFVELESIDETDYPGITFDVTVDSRRIDSTETATLVAILQNTSDTTLEFEMGYRPPFSQVRCEDGGYLLVDPWEDNDLDACWEPPQPVGQPQLLTRTELTPGEVLTNAMELWGDPRTAACLPTGEFRFVSNFEVTRDGETEGRANAFTIQVARG